MTRAYSFGRGSRLKRRALPERVVRPYRRHVAEPHRFTTWCAACWGTGAAWPLCADGSMPDWRAEPAGVCARCQGTGVEPQVVDFEQTG